MSVTLLPSFILRFDPLSFVNPSAKLLDLREEKISVLWVKPGISLWFPAHPTLPKNCPEKQQCGDKWTRSAASNAAVHYLPWIKG